MRSLASVSADECEYAVAQGELFHPLMASLRARLKKGVSRDECAALVVEASPLTLAEQEIQNDPMDSLHGLLAAGGPPTAERMAAARLGDIAILRSTTSSCKAVWWRKRRRCFSSR